MAVRRAAQLRSAGCAAAAPAGPLLAGVLRAAPSAAPDQPDCAADDRGVRDRWVMDGTGRQNNPNDCGWVGVTP